MLLHNPMKIDDKGKGKGKDGCVFLVHAMKCLTK